MGLETDRHLSLQTSMTNDITLCSVLSNWRKTNLDFQFSEYSIMICYDAWQPSCKTQRQTHKKAFSAIVSRAIVVFVFMNINCINECKLDEHRSHSDHTPSRGGPTKSNFGGNNCDPNSFWAIQFMSLTVSHKHIEILDRRILSCTHSSHANY